jgi:drug/metabolite transporter (DMT)-like permease
LSAPLLSKADLLAAETRKGVLGATVTALCWAVLALFLKYALLYTSSETLSWFRLFFSAVCLLVYFLWKRQNPFPKFASRMKDILWAGALLAVNYLGYIKGIEYTSPSHAQIMIQGASLSLFLIGVFFFKEKVTNTQWLGLALTIAGFTLFYFDQAPESGDHFVAGNIWLIAASVAWGVFAAIQKNLLRSASTTEVNLMVFLISSVFLMPLVDFGPLINLSTFEWVWLGFCGLNTLIAYNALAYALGKVPASVVGPIITLNPLLTIALMFVLTAVDFHVFEPDKVHVLGVTGALFVVLGVILIVTKNKNKRA